MCKRFSVPYGASMLLDNNGFELPSHSQKKLILRPVCFWPFPTMAS